MTDHDDFDRYRRSLEALNAEHNRTVHELRRAVDTLTDAKALAAKVHHGTTSLGRSVIDHMALRALLDLLAGVPGGGEPQPTTSTDDVSSHGESRNAMKHQAPDQDTPGPEAKVVDLMAALEDSVAKAKAARQSVRERMAAVRSAGGGDQPDTPCPECGGEGGDHDLNDRFHPCLACTDKAQP